MRSSILVAAIAVLCALLALSVGSRFGVWGSTEPGNEADGTQMPSANGRVSKRRNARERLNRKDMAIARAAVLRQSNLSSPWREVPVETDNSDPGCRLSTADLSRFTVTGKARSMFKGSSPALIESRVKVFANSWQASEFFRLTSGQTTLDCMREGVQGALSEVGASPELIGARVLTRPTFGEQTAIYTFGFWVQGRNNTKYEYPVEVFTFRMGRAVAGLSFSFIAAKGDEVGLSRIVAARLMQTARG